MKHLLFELAPAWVPPVARRRRTYELMLLLMPKEDVWTVATRDEATAVSDRGSFTGLLLRDNAAILSLPYCSDN